MGKRKKKLRDFITDVCFIIGILCVSMMDNPNALVIAGVLGSWSMILTLTWGERREREKDKL